MVPQTGAALLAFWALVVPGLVFEFLRRSRRPAFARSAFEEIATIALASGAFTGLAILSLAAVREWRQAWIPDLSAWARAPGKYFANHTATTARFVILGVVLACLYAVFWHAVLNWLGKSRDGTTKPARAVRGVVTFLEKAVGNDPRWASNETDVWRTLFVEKAPPSTQPVVSVQLKDGRMLSGQLAAYTNTGSGDERDLALHAPVNVQWPQSAASAKIEAADYRHIIVPAREIVWIAVRYDADVARTE